MSREDESLASQSTINQLSGTLTSRLGEASVGQYEARNGRRVTVICSDSGLSASIIGPDDKAVVNISRRRVKGDEGDEWRINLQGYQEPIGSQTQAIRVPYSDFSEKMARNLVSRAIPDPRKPR